MIKRNAFLPVLLALLILILAAAVPGHADKAEDLTAGCTLNVVDKPGKIKCITDGKYTTFWESSSRKKPYIIISSNEPIYGLYLCFQKMPDTYVIQKESGDDWVTVAEGGNPRFHHAFFELDGLKKIRILSTMEKKNVMGFNEIYAFGRGEVPAWVQRWEEPAEKADLLVLVAHPDDELLFTGGAIPTYGGEKGKQVEVAYLTYSNTTRRSEALNGLWAMGVRNYPVFGGFSDSYSNGKTNSAKLTAAYKKAGGKQKVLDWVNELYRRFKPEVVITHAENGEYGHAQHIMTADAARNCFTLAADAGQSPDSAQAYGTWQVKKLYLHQYGEEAEQTVLDWDQPLSAFDGKTGAQLASEAFAMHESQDGMGMKIKGKFVAFTVEETGAKMFPYDHFGLQSTTVGPDEAKNDLFEHIEESGSTKQKPGDEPVQEEPAEAAPEEDPAENEPSEDETAEKESAADEAETVEETLPQEPDTEEGPKAEALITSTTAPQSVPEWAEVTVNSRGYLDAGEYVLEDEENGHWMYVSTGTRVQIERKAEELEVIKKENNVKKKVKTKLVTYTAHIWTDIENGEAPRCVFNNPDPKKRSRDHAFVAKIAEANHAVFATSADYYTYRISMSYPTGIEVRNGEIIFDDPHKLEYDNMPTYETLALYQDGHMESWSNQEKDAGTYVAEGASQVYTFGPCLVKDGKLTDYIEHAFLSTDIRYALGMVEPGHYVAILSEGRIKRSQGIQMGTLAQRMLDEGCQIAVNLDGGQSAVFAFMGKQLNTGAKDLPKGRKQAEIIAFGFSDLVGAETSK